MWFWSGKTPINGCFPAPMSHDQSHDQSHDYLKLANWHDQGSNPRTRHNKKALQPTAPYCLAQYTSHWTVYTYSLLTTCRACQKLNIKEQLYDNMVECVWIQLKSMFLDCSSTSNCMILISIESYDFRLSNGTIFDITISCFEWDMSITSYWE